MRLQASNLVVASATLLSVCRGFSVTQSGDANTLAAAIFQGGLTVLTASFSGASVAVGTFADGPFGIGNAGILTTGAAVGALPGGDHYVNNGAAGSDTYCGSNTFNAAILTVDILNPFNGLRVEVIVASEEEGGSPDPIGVFVNNQQYAFDFNGDRLTATSSLLAFPLVITPPNSVTSYPGSSPPVLFDVLATGAQTVVLAICDFSDTEWDSALLVKVEGCDDCDTDLRLAYVTTTTTVAPGETAFTSTTTASGTVSGTIRIGVLPEEATTTTEEPTTTTEDTTTAEPTTTTEDTTTAEPTTTTEDTTTEEPTTATEDTTTEDPTTTEGTTEATQDTTTTTEDTTAEESTTTTEDTTEATQDITTTETTSEDTATTTQEPTTETSIEDSTTTTAQDTTTATVTTTDTLTEAISTMTSTLESSETTETTTDSISLVASDTTSEPLILSTESTTGSDTISESLALSTESTPGPTSDITSTGERPTTTTTEAQESSTDITTGTETADISDLPDDNTTSTLDEVEQPSISSTTQPISASADESSTILSNGITSESVTAVPSTLEGSSTVATEAPATSSVAAFNLPEIGSFVYAGCLGSPAGYPSFELIGEGPEMTPIECVRSAGDRPYIGLYLRSCYAADALDSVDTVTDGRCNLLCPGDPSLFCGGLVDPGSRLEPRFERRLSLGRRDAPPGILLTFYARLDANSGSSSASGILSTSELSLIDISSASSALPASIGSSLLPVLTTESYDSTTANPTIPVSIDSSLLSVLTTESADSPTANPTNFLSLSSNQALNPIDDSSTQSSMPSIASLEPWVSSTRLPGINPIIPPFPTSASYNAGNFSKTAALGPIVTTIVYTIVDPYDPSYLTVTEFCTTLRSPPCRHCHYQRPPTVEMTTIQVDCNACGLYGENSIVLDVPAGALLASQTMESSTHETGRVLYHNPDSNAEKESPSSHRARPNQGDSHSVQPYRSDKPVPEAGDKAHETAPYKVGQHITYSKIKPTPVGDKPQPTIADNDEQKEYYAQTSPNTPPEVTKAAPKPMPTGGTEPPEPQEETELPEPQEETEQPGSQGGTERPESQGDIGHHKHVEVSKPIIPATPPDSPIVIVSRGVQKATDGMLMMISLLTGLVFLL